MPESANRKSKAKATSVAAPNPDVTPARRRLELTLALVAAVAALLAASLSALVTLRVQSTQSELEERRLQHEQRLGIYSAYVVAAQGYLVPLNEMGPCSDPGLTGPPVKTSAMELAQQDLLNAAARVRLVGSEEAAKSLQRNSELADSARLFVAVISRRGEADQVACISDEDETEYFGTVHDFETELDRFVLSMREELSKL